MAVQQGDISNSDVLLRSRSELYEFRYRIERFEQLANAGRKFTSLSFFSSGHEHIEWSITVSPTLDEGSKVSKIEFSLKEITKEPHMYAEKSKTFFLVKANGDIKAVSSSGYRCGRKGKLDCVLQNGVLAVGCCLRLNYYSKTAQEWLGADFETIMTSADNKEVLEDLQYDLEDLYNSGRHSDVLIRCGDQEFKVHKAILSTRSSAFSKMFESDMKESRENIVTLEYTTPEAVRAMLQYIYFGIPEKKTAVETFIQLYYLAERYNIKGLKSLCSNSVTSNLCIGNVCAAAIMAHLHHDELLLCETGNFFNQHMKDIVCTTAWIDLVSKYPVLAEFLVKR